MVFNYTEIIQKNDICMFEFSEFSVLLLKQNKPNILIFLILEILYIAFLLQQNKTFYFFDLFILFDFLFLICFHFFIWIIVLKFQNFLNCFLFTWKRGFDFFDFSEFSEFSPFPDLSEFSELSNFSEFSECFELFSFLIKIRILNL